MVAARREERLLVAGAGAQPSSMRRLGGAAYSARTMIAQLCILLWFLSPKWLIQQIYNNMTISPYNWYFHAPNRTSKGLMELNHFEIGCYNLHSSPCHSSPWGEINRYHRVQKSSLERDLDPPYALLYVSVLWDKQYKHCSTFIVSSILW